MNGGDDGEQARGGKLPWIPLKMGWMDEGIGIKVRRLQLILFEILGDALETSSLPRMQYILLVAINENPGVSQSYLAHALRIHRPNIVRLVKDLVSAGLVERCASDNDRRVSIFRSTAQGRRLVASVAREARAREVVLTSVLSPDERSLFVRLLDRLGKTPPAYDGTDIDPADTDAADERV